MKGKQKGITLIALVITIIVLLILAGVSIATLTGQNGVLTQANNAKIAQAHGNVKDSMALAYNEYQLEKQTQNVGEIEKVASTSKTEIKGKEKNYLARLDTFLDFLSDKGFIESKETGKIIVDKLTGAHQVIGNGEGETDIYKIEGTEGTYKVKYYNNEGNQEEIWTVTGNESKPQGDTKSIKLLVESGDDGNVVLPIPKDTNNECIIDWGDGSVTEGSNDVANVGMKIANIDTIKLGASYTPIGYTHKYNEKNKQFEVEISGKVLAISNCRSDIDSLYSKDCLLKVLQWGETGLTSVDLGDNIKLTSLSSPTDNSFIDVRSFRFSGCTQLKNIPEDLFKNCDNVLDFFGCFSGCTNITKIPEGLFKDCVKVENFYGTFKECKNIKEIPATLFENCSNVTTFMDCFMGCEGLTEVPEGLFNNCTEVEDFCQTFSRCINLKTIPLGLFDKCLKVKKFSYTFNKCNLQGEAIPLWERVEGYENLDFNDEDAWEGTLPDGMGCYSECYDLSNNDLIPYYWK